MDYLYLSTQSMIKSIKSEFEYMLANSLHLFRVSAPKFIKVNTGIQDDLANTCTSVKFDIPDCGFDVEMVHSLAKWKRLALKTYKVIPNYGIYTDMDAIRKDETLDFMHSVYVDQWDWEIHIQKNQRTEIYLRNIVERIYNVILEVKDKYGDINQTDLPNHIHFIHSEELEALYPNMTRKERENNITRQHGAVFLMGIGYPLKNGQPHDVRSIDYDDWVSENGNFHGLNGDILVWNSVTECAFEISSMGIRVDSVSLKQQAELTNSKIDTEYHKMILNDELPLSCGGGVGQSRLAMFILGKKHIGEVQVSEWPVDMVKYCKSEGINLL